MKTTMKNQRGVAAVEFALILIPLVLLVFGTIEFGTALYDKAVITNASREGARAGILYINEGTVGAGDIAAVVSTYCGNNMISLGGNSSVATNVTWQGAPPNSTVTVRVTYLYNFLVLPSFVASLAGGINLQAETVMRMEDQGGVRVNAMALTATHRKNERGATAVLVVIVMLPLIALTALAIDIAHLYVVRNELQNAADAGALAAALSLYLEDETQVNVGANQIGYDTAISNKSEKIPVEVNWSGGNGGDVQRGHWTFSNSTFTPNATTEAFDLWDLTEEELDASTDFINAVRVRTHREATPAAVFFAGILGYEGFGLHAEAVAYLGFAGSLRPFDVDEPIAICEESILQDGKYTCSVGRMINSGGDMSSNETGGWTNFNQDSPCAGGTNAQEVGSLICSGGNTSFLTVSKDMGTNNGEITSAFSKLIDCWRERSENGTRPWQITLPVISCPPDDSISTCAKLRGAVTVNVVWITENGTDPHYTNAPTQMAGIEGGVSDWINSDPDGEIRWQSFTQHFNLRNQVGDSEPLVPYDNQTIYFLPNCTDQDPAGVTGGGMFGIRAKIPVLVQ